MSFTNSHVRARSSNVILYIYTTVCHSSMPQVCGCLHGMQVSCANCFSYAVHVYVWYFMFCLGHVPAKRDIRPVISYRKASTWVKWRKYRGWSPRHSWSFLKALAFPKAYEGSRMPLGRDISYLYHILGYYEPRIYHTGISDPLAPSNAAIWLVRIA